jgi:two-component system, chemotaxis family, protein-glutamate methylesterase/glutaminase
VTPLTVSLARSGQQPLPGDVLIAPHGSHMGMTKSRRVALSNGPAVGGHRPSATYLFRSIAQTYAAGALCLVLTGMGEDGVAGLQAVKAVGGRVLAQDESSSVVYGMPGAAVRAGVVDESLSLQDLPFRIAEAFRLA